MCISCFFPLTLFILFYSSEVFVPARTHTHTRTVPHSFWFDHSLVVLSLLFIIFLLIISHYIYLNESKAIKRMYRKGQSHTRCLIAHWLLHLVGVLIMWMNNLRNRRKVNRLLPPSALACSLWIKIESCVSDGEREKLKFFFYILNEN